MNIGDIYKKKCKTNSVIEIIKLDTSNPSHTFIYIKDSQIEIMAYGKKAFLEKFIKVSNED